MPDPPRGNATDPTGQKTSDEKNTSGIFSNGAQPDPGGDLHTVGTDPTRHGALGKTDANLGQDTPIDAGTGMNRDSLDEDEAA